MVQASTNHHNVSAPPPTVDYSQHLRSLTSEIDDRLKPATDRAITYFSRLCGVGPPLIEERHGDELVRLASEINDVRLRACANPVISRMREMLKLGQEARRGTIETDYSDAAGVLVDNAARELRNRVRGLVDYLGKMSAP